VPVELFPSGLRAVASALPSYWYAEAGREAAASGAPAVLPLLVLTGFAALFAALTVVVARRRPLTAVAG
jgi:ABC-2 type transport system permease protein